MLLPHLFLVGNVSAKQVYCHPGWGGGDHGYYEFEELIISDKPVRNYNARDEADPGYMVQKGAQSAALRFYMDYDDKGVNGKNPVIYYYPMKGTKASFAKANYAFAKKCLAKELSPGLRKQIRKAALNPKQ